MTKREKERTEILNCANKLFADACRYSEFERIGAYYLIKDIYKGREFDENSILISELKSVLGSLDSKYNEILRLHYWEGMILGKIGERFGVTGEAIRQLNNRATNKIYCESKLFLLDEQIKKYETKLEYLTALRGGKYFKSSSPIEVLNLSTRTFKALKRKGVVTIEHIMCLSYEELLVMKNIGINSVKEIIESVRCIYPGWKPYLSSFEEIGLSVRSINALRKANINTVEQLMSVSENRLKRIYGLGRISMEEIRRKKQEIINKY